jgi:hypothetical protein
MSTAISSPSAVSSSRELGWIRGATFDYTLIIGVAALAMLSGAIVTVWPESFPVVLFLDLWLLGYHHVISTFTRLSFDKDNLSTHRFLVFVLPWIVLAATILVGITLGTWAIATVYLYWQWFHYTRQSYGLVRIYSRKAGDIDSLDAKLRNWVVYLVPLWGIAYRSYQNPDTFLGAEVFCIPTPLEVVYVLGIAAVAATGLWALRLARAAFHGELHYALELYMLTHLIVFSWAYLVIPSMDFGWLVVNVWHNAQYLMIVWMFNNNRFKRGVDSQHPLLSAISQSHAFNIACYLFVCLGITSIVYGALNWALSVPPLGGIPLAALIVYQTINFHHYIVDSLIWKVRRKNIQATLSIPS